MSSMVTFFIGMLYVLNVFSAKRIVNVLLTEYSAGAVVKELVRCLALFPNLHTVQLFSDRWCLEEPVNIAFKGKSFPSVRTVTFNQPTLPILASFPEARNVPLLRCGNSVVLDRLCRYCPKLEVLRGFEHVNYVIQSQCRRFFSYDMLIWFPVHQQWFQHFRRLAQWSLMPTIS
jgi:hypothetical protein